MLAAAVAIGAAAVTSNLGLSPELGAFLAGFLLAATPFRHQVSGQLAPMRDLFMAIFFTAVGLDVSAHIVAQYWWVVGLVVVCLVLIKTFSIALAAWSFGASGPISIRSAMAQLAEFPGCPIAVHRRQRTNPRCWQLVKSRSPGRRFAQMRGSVHRYGIVWEWPALAPCPPVARPGEPAGYSGSIF